MKIMTGLQILTAVLEIIVGGLTTVGTAIGTALSSMATAIFIDGTGLSIFAIILCVFAGISLAFGLTRWVVNWIASFGNRNR